MTTTRLPTLDVSLVDAETQLILEALAELEAKWAGLSETHEGTEKYGNDLVALRLLLGRLRPAAVERFGFGVVNTSRRSL